MTLKKHLYKIFFFTCCLWLTLGTLQTAWGQSYNDAYQQYMKSDFKGAIVTLNKVVKNAFQKEDLSRAFKLLGIAYYMDGNKEAAAKAFRFALKNDPNIAITKTEVLDESIVEFFHDQKTIMEDELLMKQMNTEERKFAAQKKGGGNPPAPEKGPKKSKVAKAAPKDDEAIVGIDTGAKGDPMAPPPPAKKTPATTTNDPMALDKPQTQRATSGVTTNKKSGGAFTWCTLMPLGISQICNGSYLWAAVFAGAEIGSLAMYYQIDSKVNQNIATNDTVQNDPSYTQDQKNTTYDSCSAYTKKERSQQTYMLAAFGISWGVGAVQAYLGAKSTKSGGKSGKNKKATSLSMGFIPESEGMVPALTFNRPL